MFDNIHNKIEEQKKKNNKNRFLLIVCTKT